MVATNRTWTSFDIAHFCKNAEIIADAIQAGIEIFGMENANTYTFEPITDTPMRGLCPTFAAVHSILDATALRQKGLTLPILVLNKAPVDGAAEYVPMLLSAFLAQSVSDMAELRALQKRVMITGGVLRFHLNVEMSSEGAGFHYLCEEDSIEELVSAMCLTGAYCEGIMTELSKLDPIEVNEQKIAAFNRLASRLEDKSGHSFSVKHFFLK